jgi:hypothetical protein
MPNILIHIASNLIIVGIIYLFSKYIIKKDFNWKFASVLLISSNFIDVDHFLATPIFDAARCSINFHPLHSWYMFPIYLIGLFIKKYSFLFIGIFMHLLLDYVDCFI